MTFGPRHYVPVLKVKRGEKTALQSVALDLRAEITPLLEIVEWRRSKEKPRLSDHLKTAFKDLAKSLRLYPRCFLDAQELESEGEAGVDQVFTRAIHTGLQFTPVTGLSRESDTSAALRHRERGLAIRLTRAEFEAGNLSLLLRDFMTRHAVEHEATDLIVDLGPVEDMVTEGVSRFAAQFLADVPASRLMENAHPVGLRVSAKHGRSRAEVARRGCTFGVAGLETPAGRRAAWSSSNV